MRVLLQKKTDGSYFQNAQSWVTDSDEAQDFLTTGCALDKVRRLRLADVQVVLKWPELSHPRYDVVIPITPPQPRLRS